MLGNFILLVVSQIYNISPFMLNYPIYFQILARFSSLGPEARELLLKAQFIGRAMELLYGFISPCKDKFMDMNDLGIIEQTLNPEIGLPTFIDFKTRTYF